ncbi:MAG TPA: hypothetical protein VFC34_04360, partial [Puia sp.]|nr:hypothetical protein [Puia sp.]
MNEDRLWFLLARNLSGEASDPEAEELRLLFRQNPDKQYLADIISTYFKAPSSGTETENAGIDFNQRLQRIILADIPKPLSSVAPEENAPAENKKRIFRIRQLLPYAAALMGIGFTVWLVYRSSK